MSRSAKSIGIFVCLMMVAAGAAAQVSTGEIFGKATDTTGAVLPGATVTLTGASLIQPLVAVTTETGAFRFPRIPIGTYTLTFDLTGFKKHVRSDIIIQAGFNAEVNARLEISTVQETVTVTGASPVIDTQSTTLSASFTKDTLEKIPNARDPWVIIQQTPGMVMSGANVGGNLSGQQTLINIVERAREMGLEVRRDDVRFVLEVVSEADPWFEQGASANLFAGRFRNFVVARCRGQGLTLSADELDLIDAWFAGGTLPQSMGSPRATAQKTATAPVYQAPAVQAPQAAPPAAEERAPQRWWSLDDGRSHTAEQRAGGQNPSAHAQGDEFPRIVRTRLRG